MNRSSIFYQRQESLGNEPPKENNKQCESFLNKFQELLACKTNQCRHEGGCFKNTAIGIAKSFGLGFGMKALFHIILQMIFSKKNNSKSILAGFKEKKLYDLPLFFCIQTGLLKGILCLLRRLNKSESGFNAFLSGFLSSLIAMGFFQSKTNVYNWRMLAYMRVIEGIYLQLANRGYFKKNKFHFTLMYCIGSILMSYGCFYESRIAEKDVVKLYMGFSNLSESEKVAHYVFIERAEKKLNFND